MNEDVDSILRRVGALMDEYRSRCLWYLREDYYPAALLEACRALEAIERHGDVEAFRRAATLRQWLLRNSSEASAE